VKYTERRFSPTLVLLVKNVRLAADNFSKRNGDEEKLCDSGISLNQACTAYSYKF
jgi:hypothetical protein